MDKITKKRVEKCLNDYCDLANDLLKNTNLLESYDTADCIKRIRDGKNEMKYLAERILNKDRYPAVSSGPSKAKHEYVYVELKKSKIDKLGTGDKLSKATESMDEFKEELHK